MVSVGDSMQISDSVEMLSTLSHCGTSSICFFILKGQKRRMTLCLYLQLRFQSATTTEIKTWSEVSLCSVLRSQVYVLSCTAY